MIKFFASLTENEREYIDMIDNKKIIQYINLKLSMLGAPAFGETQTGEFAEMARSLLFNLQEKNRLLSDYLCPVDYRIKKFLNTYFKDELASEDLRLPEQTFTLDQPGLARMLSLPPNRDKFESDIVNSYRIKQGVLHNPKHDRRTTKGVFHIVEGGLDIPADKKTVPKIAFVRLFCEAMNPPNSLLRLPFTASQRKEAHVFVSLYQRPIICPEVIGYHPEISMETRFIVPGSIVSNLDFVESIFGNAGDPYLPENDAGLDVEHWSGHSGCIILAPHLISMTKKELGLPHESTATDRQKHDGMCWNDESELYNDGLPFKLTCRDETGVIVTLIADNYFGYSKKEIKTQISYASNLYGNCEEEHSGGAIAFPSYDLGDDFSVLKHLQNVNHTFAEVVRLYGDLMDLQPEGYGIDKLERSILYIPETAVFHLSKQQVSWNKDGIENSIRLTTDKTYVLPSGYKVRLTKGTSKKRWRLIGTTAEGTFCHKPSTVSGGGKSEISKSIADAFKHGPIFVSDIKKDFDRVEKILKYNFEKRFTKKSGKKATGRPILSKERTLGSVIKLLMPSGDYTKGYNEWLNSIPKHVRELVFVLKQYYQPEWGEDWRKKFSVDIINGSPGYELKYNNQNLITNCLRVGHSVDGALRIFGLRRDFSPSVKLQMEDDITASITVPCESVEMLNANYKNESVKFVKNCENKFFQRPDDAIQRGYDKQTESDFTKPDNFISNFEPLTHSGVKKILQDSIGFDEYSMPMKDYIRKYNIEGSPAYFACSSKPRIVDGKISKNPRYLQTRPDFIDDFPWRLAEIGMRFYRRIPLGKPVHTPINALLPGRRNNPPDIEAGIRSIAVYNPIHYSELPELFMGFICSVTGKSPSTTGAGSEGALTKGPFNALLPIIDLNNALVSYILTGYDCFITAAGYVGPHYRVDHDISLLIPEIWCRIPIQERDPKFLIKNGYLEKCVDFEHKGKTVLASRLGYRITSKFVSFFLSLVFNNPSSVFREPMLKPETQDMDIFADGMDNIISTQKRVAELYFDDGGIDRACPPLKALLYIMRDGLFEGNGLDHPKIRRLFTKDYLFESEWYKKRLKAKQSIDKLLWKKHIEYLSDFFTKKYYRSEARRLKIKDRFVLAEKNYRKVCSKRYLESLHGTIGADIIKSK